MQKTYTKGFLTCHRLTWLIAALLASSAANAQQSAQAQFIDSKGNAIGSATLSETPAGVLINVKVSGLDGGEHGFHIHETGRCDAPDFKSAGGHYNPTNAKHGYFAGEAIHAGDMPNQFVSADNVLQAHVINTNVSLTEGEAGLFDDDGSAIIIHSGADDYTSQPAGDAGDRVACAVIEPSP